MIKRAMDIVLASLGMLFLAPFFPFIAAAIYLDSPGPIFYRQERVGKGGRIFRVYKFRSMVPDAEKGRAVWAKEDDPRVTRVGRILRRTHVDEFPQFLNILKGEMSAVGPRPERPEFVEELAKEIPFYRMRHAVKPGMAGWGLVKQGYGASKEDALLKLQYDLYYIKHQSLWLDIVILLKTIVDTLTLRGR
jgi:exopolysaccharide biosynthesis polyprenyl glycosylphosphotransferase